LASIRIKRLEKELFKIISSTISYKLRDKRLSCVTVTSIRLTSDMSLAKVFFTQYDKLANAVVQDTLQRSSGAIKKEIAAAKLMRTIPNLKFVYDELEENARNLEDIFAQIRSESPVKEEVDSVEDDDSIGEEESIQEDDSAEDETNLATKED